MTPTLAEVVLLRRGVCVCVRWGEEGKCEVGEGRDVCVWGGGEEGMRVWGRGG